MFACAGHVCQLCAMQAAQLPMNSPARDQAENNYDAVRLRVVLRAGKIPCFDTALRQG